VPGRLAGKRAVITAAAQGIGRASAEMFVREGAHVIATDVNGDGLATLAGCDPRQLDVTDTQAIAALAAAAGPVDILFNCAGIVHGGTVLECTSEDWSRAFEVLVSLADAGDCEAARLSLMMHEHGARLFGGSFAATPSQYSRWLAASQSA